jgi:glycosyltransferase involved in cell wall biosynthesis
VRSLLGAVDTEAEVIHIVTGEYPPDPGGVSGYSEQLAHALVAQGKQVHVWTAGTEGESDEDGVVVHRVAGRFHPQDLKTLGRQMDLFDGPRRVLVQWTPPSFGMRGLNLAFALWLLKRSSANRIELMVHEAFIAFGEGNWRRDAAAVVQRAMTIALLRAAGKVWVAIPKWEQRLRPWAFGKKLSFEWLPIPSNIAAVANVCAIVEIRRECTRFRCPLIGHFGTFRKDVGSLLVPAILALESSRAVFLLVGRGSEEARRDLVTNHPEWCHRIFSTGELDSDDIATNLSACDVLLQPYPDGISSRRSSVMAALNLGVPVITNLGHLSETFWSAGGAIAIAASSSACDLGEAALDLLEDPARRSRMSAAARELYQKKFHIRHTVTALLRPDVLEPHCQEEKTSRASAA